MIIIILAPIFAQLGLFNFDFDFYCVFGLFLNLFCFVLFCFVACMYVQATSSLFGARSIHVKKRIVSLEKALANRNFDEFAKICMSDSNEMHSICLSSLPPIFYLNDTSKLIIEFIHNLNEYILNNDKNANKNGYKYVVCYTFDAGSNAILIVRNSYYLSIVLSCLQYIFQLKNDDIQDPLFLVKENKLDKKNKSKIEPKKDEIIQKLVDNFCNATQIPKHTTMEKIILTEVGRGAHVVTQ